MVVLFEHLHGVSASIGVGVFPLPLPLALGCLLFRWRWGVFCFVGVGPLYYCRGSEWSFPIALQNGYTLWCYIIVNKFQSEISLDISIFRIWWLRDPWWCFLNICMAFSVSLALGHLLVRWGWANLWFAGVVEPSLCCAKGCHPAGNRIH